MTEQDTRLAVLEIKAQYLERIAILETKLEERSDQLVKAFESAEESRKVALSAYPTKEDFNKLQEQVTVLRATSDNMAGRTTGSSAMADLIFKVFPILISSGVLAWQFAK